MSKRSADEAPSPEDQQTPGRVSPMLLLLAWLLPGLGHLLLKRYQQAAVFAFVVLAGFATGLALSGELATPQPGNPFSYLATAGCLGNGIVYFLFKLLGLGQGDATAAGFSYGNTFLYTAGVMNLLAVLDVSDVATGRKTDVATGRKS